MTSGPCPDCFSGAVSDATPTGTTTIIRGVPTYVARPDDGVKPKGLVVIVADSFGWEFVNSRVLADVYARKGGFVVYLPDLLPGGAMSLEAMPLIKKIMTPASWFMTIFYKPFFILRAAMMAIPFFIRNRPSIMKPHVFSYFQALRASPPPFPTNSPLKIGVAGFCFGGKFAVLLAQDTPSSWVPSNNLDSVSAPLAPLVNCAFIAHPSLLDVPKDIEAVQRPLSVAIGDHDMALNSKLTVKMKGILDKKGDDHECVILPGAKHGFAVRATPNDPVQMGFADVAEKQAINWFTKWFT